jgi:putative PIN family toxin of toxin-antitoxin system
VSHAVKARVVFDTNVVLSALLFRRSRLSWLVGHWQAGNCVPLVSRATGAELTRLLAYPKFQLFANEQFEVLGGYIPFCEVADVIQSCPTLCRDPRDQAFLNLAHSGKADLLVTGYEDLLVLTGQTEFAIETAEVYRHRVLGSE